ncbi:MAG TPA: glutamyl-tRNA reductase [Acidimicrobiales bacterium]|nr:glutamyl-tRNA reductase [Acidimicrobiales bacterium]
MAVVAVGIHERNAPFELFEKAAVAEADLAKALRQLTDSPQVSEAVVVSTCMRTEIYAVVERFHDGLSDIEAWLRGRVGDDFLADDSPPRRPEPGGGLVELGRFACWYDDAAVAHLFEVAAGLDSPVLGEGEILRQVRSAAEQALAERASGPVLGLLFRHAVEAGKRVRSETAIQRGTTSLAHAVVELAADHALGLEGRRVLLVGAGEMGTGIAKALAGRRDLTGEVVVANRGEDRGRSVADLVAGRSVTLEQLPDELVAADVVLTSTAAGEVILSRERLEAILARREGRQPLVVVDAAVPRDVDPAVGEVEGVVLLDMEDVRRFAEEQMAGRLAEVPAARSLLAEELERYRMTAAGRLAAPVVSALHARSEQLRLEEMAHFGSRLEALDPADRELVETLTRRVVAKLLHEPTIRVKDAAGSPRGERLAEALRTLFDL